MLFSKNTAYLIDSENVGSTWVNLLKEKDHIDFFIFVTENAKNLNFSLLREVTENKNRNTYKIYDCETGKNSLDFYLSSYLGYLIGKNRHTSYVIVSQDKGYDHVIEFWKKEGFSVERIDTKPVTELIKQPARKKTSTKVKEETKSTSEKRVIEKKKTTTPKKKPVKEPQPKEEVKTLTLEEKQSEFVSSHLKDYASEDVLLAMKVLNAADPKDKNSAYVKLVEQFAQEKGLAIYTALRKDLSKYYRLSETKKESA